MQRLHKEISEPELLCKAQLAVGENNPRLIAASQAGLTQTVFLLHLAKTYRAGYLHQLLSLRCNTES